VQAKPTKKLPPGLTQQQLKDRGLTKTQLFCERGGAAPTLTKTIPGSLIHDPKYFAIAQIACELLANC
jgi:hypothetical protein